MDSGLDAGDAGMRDAGLRDSGPRPDGETAPLEMQSTMVAMEVSAFEAARDAAPMTARLDGSIVDLELGANGLDALIGENGLDTLALSDATVRALADLQHASNLYELLDGAISRLGTASDPDVIAMRDAAARMRDALVPYKDELRVLYRNRLDLGIIGTPMPFSWGESHTTFGLSQIARFGFVIEGMDMATPEAIVYWNCELGRIVDSITVIDEETGATLGGGVTPGMMFTVPAPYGEATAVRIVFDGPAREVGNYPECSFLVQSRRQLREAPIDLTVHTELDAARMEYRLALSFLASADEDTRVAGTIDPTILDAVERQVTMLDDILSPLVASGQQMAFEDLQRIVRLFAYVEPMVLALINSPQLAGVEFDSVRTNVTSIHTQSLRIAAVAAAP